MNQNQSAAAGVKGSSVPPLEFLLHLFRTRMNKTGGNYFLPVLVLNQENPAYDPYQAAGSRDVVIDGEDGRDMSRNFCMTEAAASGKSRAIAPPGEFIRLNLINSLVKGLANSYIEKVTVEGEGHDKAVIPITFCYYDPFKIKDHIPPGKELKAYLEIGGRFTAHQNCCPTADRKTCAGEPYPLEGTGSFRAVISQAAGRIFIRVKPGGSHPPSVSVEVEAIQLDIKSVPGVVRINVEIDIDDPGDVWKLYIERALNHSSVLQTIVDNLKQEMNSSAARQTMREIMETNINRLLRDLFD